MKRILLAQERDQWPIKYGEFHDYRCPVLLGDVELVTNQFLVNYCF